MRSTGTSTEPEPRRLGFGAVPIEAGLRVLLFVAIAAYFWIGLTSLQSRADPAQFLSDDRGNTLNQLATISLFLASAGFIVFRASWLPRVLMTSSLALLLCWLLITTVMSIEPSLSAKRFILCIFIITISAAFPLLASSEKQFVNIMKILLLVMLFLNFAAILLVPSLAKHQFHDVVEASLAGDWRGLFLHKNVAGSAMVLTIFFGAYVARFNNRVEGALIVTGALVFLVFTGSKTALVLLVPSLLLAWAILKLRSTAARIALVVSVVLAFNVLTVGSVIFPEIRELLRLVTHDPTFTGRTEIWTFAVDQLSGRWMTGFGYRSFWGSTWLFSSGYELETWAARAGNAHNGYLEMIVNSGLPGLVLLVGWLFLVPLRDVTTSIGRSGVSPLTTLYVRIWTFCVLDACLESAFFAEFGPVWFSMLFAVFGLRLQASAKLVGVSRRDDSPNVA